MKNKKPTNEMKRRLLIVTIIVSFFILYIVTNYYKIQILKKDYYSSKALDSQIKNFVLPAKRGTIYDAKGEKLAYSITAYRIYLDKEKFNLSNKDELLNYLEISEEFFDEKYENENRRIALKRHVKQNVKEIIENKNFDGVWFEKDPMRIYPYGNFASRVIGNTTIDMDGISGIEYSMNKELKGIDGGLKAKTDAVGRKLAYGEEKEYKPIHGADVYLTIDEVIQHFVQKNIKKGYEDTNSKKVSAVVMNIKTGDILGMASYPSYDLNNPRVKPEFMPQEEYDKLSGKEKVDVWNKNWRNDLTSDIFEPGSTFKIITAAIGLEENAVTPLTEFNEKTGYIDVYDFRIKCWIYPGHHGKETFVQAMENSCNPVFVKVAQKIGVEAFQSSLVKFGLNDSLDLKLPGVLDYEIKTKDEIGPVELATMSYGHGVSVTPVQLIRTLSALVNNGYLVEPRIIKKIDYHDKDKKKVDEEPVQSKRQIISNKTSYDLRLMLESVVKNGSGKSANIPGIRVGGKTGTTMKFKDGQYRKDQVIASFFAFAPVEDPEIAILVILDEPEKSVFGSVVAAPIAKDILEPTLRHLGIKPDFAE